MRPKYTLEDIDTQNTQLVASEVCEIFKNAFPNGDEKHITHFFDIVTEMFIGNYEGYQAMDTSYHDIEHTMQATLCWVRLMANRHQLQITPQMSSNHFITGVIAMLFHDVGYLKRIDDTEGTGAKFTFVHEKRSCEMVEKYLNSIDWDQNSIKSVQNLINCTGPRSVIPAVPFTSELERIMGLAVCTADYLGQMSDPGYIGKLPVLFEEFEESDDYRGIPVEERLFKSAQELINGTPYFWRNIVLPKLQRDCERVYKYLADPYPWGPNPYIEKIEDHIDRLETMAAG